MPLQAIMRCWVGGVELLLGGAGGVIVVVVGVVVGVVAVDDGGDVAAQRSNRHVRATYHGVGRRRAWWVGGGPRAEGIQRHGLSDEAGGGDEKHGREGLVVACGKVDGAEFVLIDVGDEVGGGDEMRGGQ